MTFPHVDELFPPSPGSQQRLDPQPPLLSIYCFSRGLGPEGSCAVCCDLSGDELSTDVGPATGAPQGVRSVLELGGSLLHSVGFTYLHTCVLGCEQHAISILK